MISTDSPNDCCSPFADWTGQLSRPGLGHAELRSGVRSGEGLSRGAR